MNHFIMFDSQDFTGMETMDLTVLTQLVSQQAYLLGYKDGDKLALRGIPGKGFEPKKDKVYPFKGFLVVGSWEFIKLKSEAKGGGVDYIKKDGLSHLLRENLKGNGIYLIPNKGGHNDASITEVTALFYECDDIAKIDQFERIERLDVKPSLVIETRKSLHVYYVLKEGDRKVDGWRQYQQRLIQKMDSDRSVHNESRLMRLAGFFHQKKGLDPCLIDIVSSNDNQYQLSVFDAKLPKWDETKWSETKEHDVDWQKEVEAFKAKKRVLVPNNEAFPLEICLPHKDRELILGGVGKGEGYVKGFKLACNLIGTEDFLRSSGYQFTGCAEDLFKQFAFNSPESYHGQKDVDKVLGNATRKNPTPTLTAQMIENCINAWRIKTGTNGWTDTIVSSVKKVVKTGKDVGEKSFKYLTDKLFGGVTGLQRNAKRMVAGLIHSPVDHYYEPGEGAKLYAKLAREGHKWILDISGTGCGKTFTVSELQIQEMFLHPDGDDEILMRLFYIPPSYRNPTNAKIEDDWYETPARNNGYFINYSKQTELGNPYRESLVGLGEIDDHERTQSNCHKAELFHQHYAAGRSTEGLCKACDLRDKCAVKKGEGYGYISEVKKWIAEAKIRTSAQWLDKDKVSICSTGLIFDEAGQAPWQKSIKVKSEYIHKLMAKIRRADKNLHRQLVELDYAIADLIDAEDLPRYGYDTYHVLQALNVDKSLEQVLERILEIELDGREIVENEEELQEIDPVFLFDLLRIALGVTRGSLSLGKNELTISVPNDRLIQACHAAKFVICQDATMARSEMAMQLGIKESDIVVIKQRQEVPVNLVIEQWKGIGLLGNNRSDAVKELVIKIREQLLALYPELGIIEWKQHGQASDLIHCGDSRGSNAYKEKTTVASIGLSRPNMTAIRMQFETMSGHIIDSFEDSSFREFYGHKIAANLIQEIGRLRANRRPNEQLKFILVGDGDITFLEHLGFDVVSKDASEMLGGLDLGQVGAKSRYVNLGIRLCRQLGKELWESLNMSQAAEYLERAGSSVSRWVRRWFGVEGDRNGTAFQRFKALVYAAVYGGRTKGFSQEQEINITMMGEMLKQVRHCGQDLGKELKSLIDACGWSVFLESVRRLEGDYGIKLLAHIFDVAIQLG